MALERRHRIFPAFLLACFLLGGLLILQVVRLFMADVNSLFPWQQARWRLLLMAGGIWLLMFGGITAVSKNSAKNLQERFSGRLIPGLVAVLIIVFIVAYGWLAVTRHERFNSTGYDLAINEQIVWNTLHGRFFASSLEVDNSFADHFRPFLAILVPFYALFPSPKTLLILQAVGLGLGGIPVYLLAKDKLFSRWAALGITAVYLLYPAIGYITRFDFHIEALAIPAFLFAFYALERERWGWATFWLAIPLLCKENMGLTVAAFGLYVILVKRAYRWGVAWVVTGLAVFGITSFWLIPVVRGEASDTLSRYDWLGSSPTTILQNILFHPRLIWNEVIQPNRLFYLTQLFVPTGFLALLGLPELFLALPGLVMNLLARHHCQAAIYCQYTVPITPFIFIAVIVGLSRLNALLQQKNAGKHPFVSVLLVIIALFSLWVDNPFSEIDALPDALTPPANADVVQMALATVPNDAVVVTTNDYAPHLAQRPELYIIGLPSQRKAPTDPDVVFLNLYDQEYIICDQYREYVSQLDRTQFGVVFRTAGLIVIQKDSGDNVLFRDFVANWNNCAG